MQISRTALCTANGKCRHQASPMQGNYGKQLMESVCFLQLPLRSLQPHLAVLKHCSLQVQAAPKATLSPTAPRLTPAFMSRRTGVASSRRKTFAHGGPIDQHAAQMSENDGR